MDLLDRLTIPTDFPLGWADLLDVTTVAILLWAVLVWLRRARARLAFVGLVIVGAVYVAAQLLGFGLTAWVFRGFFAVLVIVVVVVFQEDLRRLFEQIALWGLRRRSSLPPTGVGDTLVRTVARLSQSRIGALILIPGREPLERHVEGGIALDALISEPLLLSLFDPGSPGHDGAALVAGGRIARFALHLPLSTNQEKLGAGGTRHAAALGLSEVADCLCIVVSEERGTVSVAQDGELRVLGRPQELLGELRGFERTAGPSRRTPVPRWRRFARRVPEVVVAFGLASALWVVHVPGSALGRTVRQATVIAENLPPEYVTEAIDPPTVKVVMSGLRRDLFFARSAAAPEVHVDVLLAKLGRRTFLVSPEDVRAPEGLEVVSVDPKQVRVTIRTRQDSDAANP